MEYDDSEKKLRQEQGIKILLKKALDDNDPQPIIDAGYLALSRGETAPRMIRDFIAANFKGEPKLYKTFENMLLAEAQTDFDCFCRFLEYNNPKGFYYPRRFYLLPVVEALQDLSDGKLKMLIVRMVSRSGKSTLASLFNLWLSGKKPLGSILAAGANSEISDVLYNKMSAFYNAYEKRFLQIFPKSKIAKRSIEKNAIWLRNKDTEYPTFKSISVESGREGATEAKTLIYLDDTQQSGWSDEMVDKAWERGIVPQVLGRITGAMPILVVGTSRGINDHQAKIIQYADDCGYDYKVLSLPALNEENKSNYECEVWETDGTKKVQFTTEYFLGKKKALSHNSIGRAQWASEYMCDPIPLEGYMFPELLRYDSLPDRNPDVILCCVDTAGDGKDSTNAQICYGYIEGKTVKGYIIDIMHDPSGSKITVPKFCNFLIKNEIREATIESNTGGSVWADDVSYRLSERGYACKINKKHANSNKHGRISGISGFILENIYFKDRSNYIAESEYGRAVDEIMRYTSNGLGVKHDDAPDVTAAVASALQDYFSKYRRAKPMICDRFF